MDPRLEPVVADTVAQRQRFEAFVRSLSAEELHRPVPETPWRVKDYVAHLATIDIWVGGWFKAWANGQPWSFTREDGRPFDIDAWNQERIDERRDADSDALLKEAAGLRAPLLATFEEFSPALLDRPFDFRGRTISFLRYLQLWTAHDPAHSLDMLRALPERAADPAIEAWVGPVRDARAGRA
jgi:hypothetical protein